MARRVNEIAGGALDGFNDVFTTSTDYRPGTLVALINGQAQPPGTTVEVGINSFRLDRAPKAQEVVSVRYSAIS